MNAPLRVAILTVSDGCAAGTRHDQSGDDLAAWVAERGFDAAGRAVVPDDAAAITSQLIRWADADVADVILTTGGTGFTVRDVTPEATRAALEREAPGIVEAIRAEARERVPAAMLSRGVAGIRRRTLVVNLPGSPRGAQDGARVIAPVLEHAAELLRGEATSH